MAFQQFDRHPMSPWHGPPATTLKDWDKVRVLGRGSYGVVYLGAPKNPDLNWVAIKSSPLHTSASILKEATVLRNFIGSPEILQFIGHEMNTENDCYYSNLILEYAPGGTLADLIKQRTKLQERVATKYLCMILRGLSSVHAKGFVHADLKPANILAFPDDSGSFNLKIADFGLAKNYVGGREGEAADGKLKFRGTPRYMSPESLMGEIKPPLDIWSLGCIFINMVTGKEVWDDCKTFRDLTWRLLDETIVPKVPEELSEGGKDFLRGCLERDPEKRWSADMLLLHPYLRRRRV